MPQPDENDNANSWLRSKNKVSISAGSSTFKVDARDQRAALVDVTEGALQPPTAEERATALGADGGARGLEPQLSEDERMNQQIRDTFYGSGSLRGRGS